jgi:putative ABC transport system permease protein
VGALVNPGRVTAPPRARRAAAALVIAEMALAIVLLTGAGLFVRSFGNLLAVDPGFRQDHVLTMDIALPAERYQASAARAEWYRRAFAALESSGSVTAAGAAEVTPLTGNNWTAPFEREDRRVPAGQRPPDVGWQAATGGYFRALQIPLLDGRLFDGRDRPDGPFVVIISAALRDRFFPGEPAVGRRIMVDEHQSAEIVGVVGNIRRSSLTGAPGGDLYFPLEQDPSGSTTLFLRTPGDPEAAVAAVRATLRSLEPLIAIRGTRTLQAIAGASIETTRLALLLLSVFAATALALAAVGIYGVMSYAVRQRTREIGTRMALGASSGRIRWMVMRDGLLTGAIGAAIGLAGGVASARALSTLLYQVSPADPLTLAASAGLLFVVAMVASYLPARRAIRLDPVKTLASR